MKNRIAFVLLLVILAVLLAACGDKSVYALSGSVQLNYEDGTTGELDLNGSTITVESVKVWPQKTTYENSGFSSEISLMVNMSLKIPESWTDEQRFALIKDLDVDTAYENGAWACDSYSSEFADDVHVIKITMTGSEITGKEISFVLSVNGVKIKGGEFKRHIN